MLIAVTGGTGFVGSAVVSKLLGRGHEVRILSRSAPVSLPGGAEHFPGSVVTGSGLEDLLAGTDAVIHLVGIIREKGENTYPKVHHEGTVNVLVAASRTGVSRYIHMSALGTREGAVSRYHRSKWDGEQAVRASGLDWTIFRPSTIFGPEDAFINMLAGIIARFPVVPVIGGEKNLMQPVSVDNVASAFCEALVSDTHAGRTYELGGPEKLNLRQIMNTISKVIEKKRVFINVPVAAVYPLVRAGELIKIPLPVTSDQLIMLGEDNIRRGGDPVEALGIDWTGFEEGIRKYLESENQSRA